MRQVPHGKTYTLIGSGRLALHLKYLLTIKGISFNQWSRNQDPNFNSLNKSLDQLLMNSDYILLAISDSSLPEFIKKYKDHHTLIHFSGSFYSKDCAGLHPLMTFSKSLYKDSFYDSIHFIIDQNLPLFDFLPGLNNPYHYIKPELKPLYHSFCTMSGNFTQILWQSMLANLEKKIGLPKSAISPFMEKTFSNLLSESNSLTGPFVRRDTATIEKHLNILDGTIEKDLYKSFLNYYIEMNASKNLNSLKEEIK